MQIVAMGSHIVECVRIGRMIETHGEQFLERVFTAREIRGCRSRKHPTEAFAQQWAAKEAIVRSLGKARNFPWLDLELLLDADGSMKVQVGGAAKERVATLRLAEILVTSAACRAYATATAIAVRKS